MDLSAQKQSAPDRDQSQEGKPNTDRRARRRSNSRLGRFFVIFVFASLSGTYLVAGHFTAHHAAWHNYAGYCYAAPLWIGALSLGLWLRQRWAQYILSAFVVLSLMGAIGLLGCLAMSDPRPPLYVLIGVASFGVVQSIAAVTLMGSRDVARLTNNHYKL